MNPIEKDPHGMGQHQAGAKLDAGKEPVSRGVFNYFPRALLEVAKVSDHGAEQYLWGGWSQVPDGQTRYRDALGRHILYEQISEYDRKSHMLHMVHIAWNALAVLELMLQDREALSVPRPEEAIRQPLKGREAYVIKAGP